MLYIWPVWYRVSLQGFIKAFNRLMGWWIPKSEMQYTDICHSFGYKPPFLTASWTTCTTLSSALHQVRVEFPFFFSPRSSTFCSFRAEPYSFAFYTPLGTNFQLKEALCPLKPKHTHFLITQSWDSMSCASEFGLEEQKFLTTFLLRFHDLGPKRSQELHLLSLLNFSCVCRVLQESEHSLSTFHVYQYTAHSRYVRVIRAINSQVLSSSRNPVHICNTIYFSCIPNQICQYLVMF